MSNLQSSKEARYRTVALYLDDARWHPFRMLTGIFPQKRWIYKQRPGEEKVEAEVTINICSVYLLEESEALQLNLGRAFSDLLDMGFDPAKPLSEKVWFLKKEMKGMWHLIEYSNGEKLSRLRLYPKADDYVITADELNYRQKAAIWLLELPSFVDFREKIPKFGPPKIPLQTPDRETRPLSGAIRADDFIFLKEGDKWKLGDQYGVGFCFTIGSLDAGSQPGERIPEGMMCYLPRRPKTAQEKANEPDYKPDSPGKRKLVI